MIKGLLSRTRRSPVPQELYGRVVTQARQPAFFLDGGVPDTVTGRFDMLCLHLFLLNRRLTLETDSLAAPLSQDLFDVFTRELDAALRELGVGDTSVTSRMKKMLASYYALIERFDPVLASGDAIEVGLRAAERFSQSSATAASFFGAYIPAAAAELAATSFDVLVRGQLRWPTPETRPQTTTDGRDRS